MRKYGHRDYSLSPDLSSRKTNQCPFDVVATESTTSTTPAHHGCHRKVSTPSPLLPVRNIHHVCLRCDALRTHSLHIANNSKHLLGLQLSHHAHSVAVYTGSESASENHFIDYFMLDVFVGLLGSRHLRNNATTPVNMNSHCNDDTILTKN